jgi:hypothetical protein
MNLFSKFFFPLGTPIAICILIVRNTQLEPGSNGKTPECFYPSSTAQHAPTDGVGFGGMGGRGHASIDTGLTK